MNIKTLTLIAFSLFISLLSSIIILHLKKGLPLPQINSSNNTTIENNISATIVDTQNDFALSDKDLNLNIEEKTDNTSDNNSNINLTENIINENILNLSATSAIVLKNDKKLLEYNTTAKMPVASLTKIVTALVAIKNYNLDQEVSIPTECTLITNDFAKAGFRVGEKFYLEDLLHALLVSSSADAACAIESLENRGDFINKMNQLVIDLGLSDTHFDNTIGIDSTENYSTINDLLKIVQYAKTSETMIKITSTKNITIKPINTNNLYNIKTTNDLLINIPGVTGFKTGYTTLAKECLILSYQNKMNNYTFIVLGSVDRFLDTTKMVNYVLSESK